MLIGAVPKYRKSYDAVRRLLYILRCGWVQGLKNMHATVRLFQIGYVTVRFGAVFGYRKSHCAVQSRDISYGAVFPSHKSYGAVSRKTRFVCGFTPCRKTLITVFSHLLPGTSLAFVLINDVICDFSRSVDTRC